MKRGDIWWANLPDPSGSGPGYRRPVLIIQSDAFNDSAIQTVIVVAITSNLRLANAPGNLLVTSQQSGLARDSVINVSQVVTVDRRTLTERVGVVPARVLEDLDAGLRLVLGL